MKNQLEKHLLGIVKKIKVCDDLSDLKMIMIEVQEKLNFNHMAYAIKLFHTLTNISHLVVSNYPDKWLTRYGEREYIKIDPVVQHCSSSQEPFCWDCFRNFKNSSVVAFIKDAAAFGLIGGVSIGMQKHNGEVGIFSLAVDHVVKADSSEYCTAALSLTVLQPYIHEAIARVSSHYKKMAKKPKLTPREKECLVWAAEGKKSNEISIILSISEATVVFHLKNSIKKLDVTNRNQAIAKAVLLGIISPQCSPEVYTPAYLF